MELAKVEKSAAYEALRPKGGRFSHLLMLDANTGLLSLCPSANQAAAADDGEAEGLL